MEMTSLIFQLISSFGAIGTFGAFLLLFRKDKNKQSQINELSRIAIYLETQNQASKKHNELIAQQVEIFRNTAILRDQDDSAIAQLRELEEKKLKLSVKPNLWLNGAGYKGYEGTLRIDLNNKGEDAKLIEFRLLSSDIILHDEHLPYDLESGKRRYIFARSIGSNHIKDAKYTIEIIYQDKLGNKYSSIITGQGSRVSLSDPLEIN